MRFPLYHNNPGFSSPNPWGDPCITTTLDFETSESVPTLKVRLPSSFHSSLDYVFFASLNKFTVCVSDTQNCVMGAYIDNTC